MTKIPETNLNPDSLDSLIERTLFRDAETTRARFATVPDARLTAKLALATASRGIFSSLAAKFALYAGAALVIGGAIYFIPSLNNPPISQKSGRAFAPAPASKAQPATSSSQATTPRTETTKIGTTAIGPREVSKAASEQAPQNIVPSTKPPALKLDEGDGKNIPKITDPHYQPPLK